MGKFLTLLFVIIVVSTGAYFLYYDPFDSNEAGANSRNILFLTASDLQLASVDGFKEGMEELGYREGVDVKYTVFNPKGDRDLGGTYAKQIVEAAPDLIVSVSTTASTQIKSANTQSQIPTIFIDVGNLERLEIGNLQRPGGFMSGVAVDNVPATPKRMEILKDVLPGMKNVAVLLNTEHVSFATIKSINDEAGRSLDLEIIYYDVNSEAELPSVLEQIAKDRPDAFMTTTEAIVSGNSELIAKALLEAGIPSIDFNNEVGAVAGYMMAFGVTRVDVGKQGARLADKVLRGQDPGTIPVEFAGAPSLDVNLAVAREIGVRIPENILLQARTIIE